jgi:ABC-2 type transport system permease protein
MMEVYRLTLRQLSGRWRLTIMTVLAMMPVLITVLMLRDASTLTVWDYEKSVLSAMLAGSIAPLVVLAIAAAAFGNELEDRTLANLTLSPIPRWKIALPKLLATITIAAPLTVVSAFVVVALYSSAFVWLGLVSSQAVGIGLLYIVLWEGFFSGFVEGVRLLSIRHYAIALMHGLDPRRFAPVDHPSLPVALLLVTAVFGGFLWLTVRQLRRMDVP